MFYMQKTITFQDFSLPYTLIRSKTSKSLRISIKKEEGVSVTIPYRVDEKVAEKFLLEKFSWVQKKILFYQENKREKIIHSEKEITDYKKKTLSFVKERLLFFNVQYGFKWKDVRIKDTKTRWGSCSKVGNLNFNYKLALLPDYLADYIIVHELCHLGEFNHSERFWNLVAKTIPHHKELRKELKKKAIELA